MGLPCSCVCKLWPHRRVCFLLEFSTDPISYSTSTKKRCAPWLLTFLRASSLMQGVVPSVFMLQRDGMDHYSLPLFYRYLVFHTFSLYHCLQCRFCPFSYLSVH